MLVVVDFSKSPGSFASATNDPIVKNVVTMRSIISELKLQYGGPSQTYVTGDLATSADSSLASDRDLSLVEPWESDGSEVEFRHFVFLGTAHSNYC